MNTPRQWFRRKPQPGSTAAHGQGAPPSFEWTYEPHAEPGGRRPSSDVQATELTSEPAKPAEPSVDEKPASPIPQSVSNSVRDPGGRKPSALAVSRPRGTYLEHQLDEALADWWDTGELPSSTLLRAGLTALERGQALDAEHRSLLLRAALYHRRGQATALRYQDDAERTALVMAEALTTEAVTAENAHSTLEAIKELLAGAPGAPAWRSALLAELRATASGLDGARRARAAQALRELSAPPGAPFYATGNAPGESASRSVQRGHWRGRRALWLLVLLFALGAGFAAIVLRRPAVPMVNVASGGFLLTLGEADGATSTAALDDFAIDRFEVTNRQYRLCVERGRCAWPASSDAAGIKDYFVDPAYDTFPVVNVDWDAARVYCQGRSKRLPSAAEWQAAASLASATGRLFVYPWGNTFATERANTAEAGRGRPVAVGSHSPAGDSPSGAADMAGNVAEWTDSAPAAGGEQTVKGGSYRDERTAARADAARLLAPDRAADWIGLRCAGD